MSNVAPSSGINDVIRRRASRPAAAAPHHPPPGRNAKPYRFCPTSPTPTQFSVRVAAALAHLTVSQTWPRDRAGPRRSPGERTTSRGRHACHSGCDGPEPKTAARRPLYRVSLLRYPREPDDRQGGKAENGSDSALSRAETDARSIKLVRLNRVGGRRRHLQPIRSESTIRSRTSSLLFVSCPLSS